MAEKIESKQKMAGKILEQSENWREKLFILLGC
jgi:hypothetical protein